jgi:hypothetical protein
MIRCNQWVLRSAALLLLIGQVACVATEARKVQCDSNLRPINPLNSANPEKP